MSYARVKSVYLEFSSQAGFAYWANTLYPDAQRQEKVDPVSAEVAFYAANRSCAFAVGDLIFVAEHEGRDVFVQVKSVEYADPPPDDGSHEDLLTTTATAIYCRCPVSDMPYAPLVSLHLEFLTHEEYDHYENTVRPEAQRLNRVDPIMAAVDVHASNGTCDFRLDGGIDVTDHEGKALFTLKVQRLKHADPPPVDCTCGDVLPSTAVYYERPRDREFDQRPKGLHGSPGTQPKSLQPSDSAASGSPPPSSPPRGFPPTLHQ